MDKRPQQLKLKSAQVQPANLSFFFIVRLKKSGWKGTKPSVKNYLMHDYSVEIEKMYREWEKRKNADNERKLLAAETAEKEVTYFSKERAHYLHEVGERRSSRTTCIPSSQRL